MKQMKINIRWGTVTQKEKRWERIKKSDEEDKYWLAPDRD